MDPILCLNIDGKRFVGLDSTTIIGRPAEIRINANFLYFPEREISRCHLELILENGIWYIRDLKSSNGTNLNSFPINSNNKWLLRKGSRIDIPGHKLTVEEFDEGPVNYALLIAHSGGDLTDISNNTRVMNSVLSLRGFSDRITLFEDEVNYQNVYNEFQRIREKIREDSQLVVYLGGHGGEEGLYLGKNRRLAYSTIFNQLRDIKGSKLFISDACHSGTSVQSLLRYDIPYQTMVMACTEQKEYGHMSPRHALSEKYFGSLLLFTAEVARYLKEHQDSFEAVTMAREIQGRFTTLPEYIRRNGSKNLNQIPQFKTGPFMFRSVR